MTILNKLQHLSLYSCKNEAVPPHLSNWLDTGDPHDVNPQLSNTTFSCVYKPNIIALFTHQIHRHRCAAPTGQNSGCGRGKETRRRGCRRCSQSPLWQFLMGGAGQGRQDVHPTEHPVERQKDRLKLKNNLFKQEQLHSFTEICLSQTHFLAHFHLLGANISSFSPHLHQWTLKIQSIHPHLYASSYAVLNLSRAQHSSHMQMFHLQAMNLISHYHCSLMGRKRERGGGDRKGKEHYYY